MTWVSKKYNDVVSFTRCLTPSCSSEIGGKQRCAPCLDCRVTVCQDCTRVCLKWYVDKPGGISAFMTKHTVFVHGVCTGCLARYKRLRPSSL